MSRYTSSLRPSSALGAGLALIAALACPAVSAQDGVVFRSDYQVITQRLADFLQLLSRDAGTRIMLSPKVRGRVEGTRLEGDLGEILDALASAHALDWFEYNGTIHVSARDEGATRLVRLGDLPTATAREELGAMGLPMGRLSIRDAAGGTALALSGPPSLLGLAEAAIESMPGIAPPPPPVEATVRVLRGGAASEGPVPTASAAGDGGGSEDEGAAEG